MMTKAALRAQYLAARRALPAQAVTQRSNAITNRFFTLLDERPNQQAIHTFLPIVRQNEVNTWPIIHRLWQSYPGVQVAVSVTNTSTNELSHHVLTPETSLTENRWGILEPQPTTHRLLPTKFDVVLVPLLAFDWQGHRVGYGKGYYDRFLAGCRPDCLKVGLSLFEPVERIEDVDFMDIQLDVCLTPGHYYSFPIIQIPNS